MPHYSCRLSSDDGRIFSQSFFAPSAKECRSHFENRGLCILSIRRDWKRIQIPLIPFEKKIKDNDFIMFNQELVALLKAGYPILKCIEIIISRVKNIHLRELLMSVETDIRSGKSLSEAFTPYESNFSQVYIASLMAGERSGNLTETLSRYIHYAKVVAKTKSRISSAMSYPTILIIFSIILMGILVTYIIPSFSRFYTAFDAQLPFFTRALMSFSLFARKYVLFFLGFLVFFFLIFLRFRKKEKLRVFIDRIKLLIPYGGTIWMESSVSLFTRTLGLLLGGGISLLSSINIAIRAVANRFLLKKMEHLYDDIRNGENLSEALKKTEYFPSLALDMIRIGETSANLEGMLGDVAQVYDDRIQAKIDRFVSLIEPIIIIFMGILVAGMLLSVYLPIFNIIKTTR